MNRVIKFRGLRVDGQGWVEGCLHQQPMHYGTRCLIYQDDDDEIDANEWVEVKRESVGQFIIEVGDKEFYEGDVIENPNSRQWTFEYFQGAPMLKEIGNKDQVHYSTFSSGFLANKKIVGNIHEEGSVPNA